MPPSLFWVVLALPLAVGDGPPPAWLAALLAPPPPQPCDCARAGQRTMPVGPRPRISGGARY